MLSGFDISSGNSVLSKCSKVYIGLGERPVCGDHKGMPKMYSEVNSLLCYASLLVCTAVVKCIYNLIYSSTYTCGVHDHLYNQCILARLNKISVHLLCSLYIKNYEFKNEVGIQAIKSSETRDERW